MDDTQGFIRVKELAKYLGIGVSTCWIKSKHEKDVSLHNLYHLKDKTKPLNIIIKVCL